ncbi:AT-rich interactive domain-containing protein 3B-like [Corythoichthys intestinalis]|uniref:AT-rich interactive domain-containing protein 3B-like n=1 Tax=Corythoichthys intestinalis TaxID=161448 RepID=UPI0025A4D831|nr:AT-rich interactive domain-containing protein 3B-like [Corythoichthys intestinalis]XP_061813247.1 AT-rich interactive domain-containing protein 3B-like [Nerophis lumbriciformis]
MMDYSKGQMSGLSEESSSARCPQSSPAGLKLEALMEQLQRQQEAKQDVNLQEKHLLQAQLLFAQHAAAAAARVQSGCRPDLFAKGGGLAQQASNNNPSRVNTGEEEEDEGDGEDDDDEDDTDEEEEEMAADVDDQQAQKPRLQQVPGLPFIPFSEPAAGKSSSPPVAVKQEQEEKELLSPVRFPAYTSANGFTDWSYDEPLKQRAPIWAEDNEAGRGRAEPSRDFAKLYELDNDPHRKEFLDDLFVFMQKRGTPVNRIPIMAKQVLDLFKLYKLVTEKGGLVEVINKKIWREITRGLNLPTSITSAAFTLRTQYMKYLYPFECEKKGLSSPGELQAAIDSNRREGRRPSYTNSLYRYSPSPNSAPHNLLSPPTVQAPTSGHNTSSQSISPNVKKNLDEASTPVIPSRMPMALALGQHQHHHQQQQQQQLAQAATLEHLRERLERAEGPEKKMMRLAEEQQRLMQQAFQQNLLAMASHFNPLNLKLNNGHENKQDLSLSISTNGAASISVSVEVNGTMYSGTLFAQKSAAPVVSQAVNQAGTSGFSAFSSSHSPSSSSSTSSKGPN